VPGERLFASIGKLQQYRRFIVARLGYMGRAVPGDRVHLLRIPGFEHAPMWTPVCFEQADARLAREAARQGARFFVNLTSEGDLGPQIFRNTEAIAVLRAIEMRVGIARCGNVGITAMIDPWGRRTHVLRGKTGALWGEPGVLTARVPMGSGRPTLYTRFGDWPAGASALVLLAALGTTIQRRRRA
jgi:apolipoprotein N-acyltransferase